MKKIIKPALFAAIALCAILTSCNKEDNMENPVPESVHKTPLNMTGLLTEDRPKRPKGKVKNNSMVDIPGADVYLYTINDSTIIDSVVTDAYGMFESGSEVTSGEYYLMVRASGYVPQSVSFTVPFGLETELDLGTIVLQPGE